jgi:hypothetical protein
MKNIFRKTVFFKSFIFISIIVLIFISCPTGSSEQEKIEPFTWNIIDGPFSNTDIRGIVFGNGKFVIVGSGGKIAYSTNCRHWTVISIPSIGSSDFFRISFCNGRFITHNGHNSKILWSTDGINWEYSEDSVIADIGMVLDITYGNGKYVAGGHRGMAYSENGVNWIAVEDSIFGDYFIWNIVYGNGKFVASSSNGGKMAYSTDGVIWTAIETTFEYEVCIIYNNKFIALGRDGIAWSTDGINWTERSNKTRPGVLGWDVTYGIAFGNGYFVAAGGGGNISWSTDGINWIAEEDNVLINANPGYSFGTIGIAFGNGNFVIASYTGKIAWLSTE